MADKKKNKTVSMLNKGGEFPDKGEPGRMSAYNPPGQKIDDPVIRFVNQMWSSAKDIISDPFGFGKSSPDLKDLPVVRVKQPEKHMADMPMEASAVIENPVLRDFIEDIRAMYVSPTSPPSKEDLGGKPVSNFDFMNQLMGLDRLLPTDADRMDQRAQPINPMEGMLDTSNVDTRQRRPLQGVQTDGTRIKSVTGRASAKADAFSARAKGIGAKARALDTNRRNALGLSSQENRRRTQ